MIRTLDRALLQARVEDLERQVDALNAQIVGRTSGLFRPEQLVTLYMDAAKTPAYDEMSARHWARQIFCLDVRQFLFMARLCRDPFPWQPFLRLLDLYVVEGFDYLVDDAHSHVLSVAQGLLNIQGLRKIGPRDVMGNPLRIKAAISTIRDRGGSSAANRKDLGSVDGNRR
jgi:hypothetical protein